MKLVASTTLPDADLLHKAKINFSARFCAATSEFDKLYIFSLDNAASVVGCHDLPDTVLDFDLLPSMTDDCALLACKDCPIQLRCLHDYRLLTSYRLKSDKDELVAANTVAFNPAGDAFVAGTRRSLCIFPVEQAGFTQQLLQLTAWNGPINCTKYFHTNPQLLAIGSYLNNLIGICDVRAENALQQTMHAPDTGSGVFQVHPIGDHWLLSNSRKEHQIHCWDLRSPGIVQSYERQAPDTFQRLFFEPVWTADLFHITYGDADGNVHFRSITDVENAKCINISNSPISCSLPFYGANGLNLFYSCGERFDSEPGIVHIVEQ